ncbi:hypothetical protein [Actinokineospora iranica]|uniref:Uncharacterized protein n=1 Tax=Actinokineospora iranica TaxID=1271860 RepID=A0A1G6Z8X5_9PSEU|nr:hypothetical protein [Actinokineospora iranica]SDD98912.1 hypothetical protein SAMN05216174_1272 [Actinokineospora iranica]
MSKHAADRLTTASGLRAIADAVSTALGDDHPAIAPPIVESVVYQAAAELAGRSHPPADFPSLLRRRAHARLLAMQGTLTPIQAADAPLSPRLGRF